MLRLKTLTRALCLTLGMAASASAMAITTDGSFVDNANLQVFGGQSSSLVDVHGTFNPTWFGNAASYASDFDFSNIWEGATLKLTQAASLTFTLVGFEAAFNNAFVFGAEQLRNFGSNGESLLGSSFSFSSTSAGPLDFGFLSNGLGSLFGNGSASVGMVLSNDHQSALLVFNDTFADRDFDDMVVRVSISPVPEPETLAMLLSGLGVVMVGVRRRGRREAAAAQA